MSSKSITCLPVSIEKLDSWAAHYLKGTPVLIAGNEYRIDDLIVRHGEGLADVTPLNETVGIEACTDNPLLKVDRSLLNRKGKREADKALEHQHVNHAESGLDFCDALTAAYSGKAIRRKGWLDKYWTGKNSEYYDTSSGLIENQMMVFETYINQGLQDKRQIDINHSCDAYATDWEAIDIE